MASIPFFLLILLSPSVSFSAFVAPITKRHIKTTPFHTLKIYLKTPLQPTDLLLHLGAAFTAVDCNRNYSSTTSHPVPCNSSVCESLGSDRETSCDTATGNHGGCVVLTHNSLALVDSLGLPVTNGRNPGQVGVIPEFVLTCSNESSRILVGHAKKEIIGLAGFGFSKFSLPAQVSNNRDSPVFAMCLSGSPSAPGVAFFDHAKPYYFLPEIDVSDHLNYTPISLRRVAIAARTGGKRYEDAYFVGVKTVIVNGKTIETNQRLVTVDQNGKGGTRISTTSPYTTIERSIFSVLVQAFVNESATMKLKPIKSVKPFSVCYDADDVSETDLGPNVPRIDLVMQNDVTWRVFGKNSMVRIVDDGLDVWCLAVVDGGVRPVSSMVIGAHQLEDNLLQFDLGSNQLGFSSSLLNYKTMCGNFNFSSNYAIKSY